ncbi:unnamed protein product, partial [Rotaria sp. Silwood2]
VFCVVGIINAISGNGIHNRMQATKPAAQVGESLTAMIFYGFGIFVAYRYYVTGLRVVKSFCSNLKTKDFFAKNLFAENFNKVYFQKQVEELNNLF